MNRQINFFLLIILLSFLSTTLSAHAAVQTLPGLSVSGIEIVANGQPVRLRGVNMGDPFWARNPDWYNYSLADYNTLSQEWRANVVRISIFPTQWKNMDHTILLNGLSQEINAALDNRMYVIISYHVIGWPDGFYQQASPGNPADTYDSSMSVATSFWSAVTQTYGSDTRIIFDLWNEPVHPDDFTLYGSDPNPLWPTLKGYYESLIQTVRTNGGQNIIIATGNRWASWLIGIKDDPLIDPNVVYAYHKYSVDGLNAPAEWDKDTGGLIGIKPVIVTEWGYEDIDAGATPTWPGSQASYGDPFTQWMESHNLSNLAWMYHYDWTPALLKSNGSLMLYGAFVKNYISSSALAPLDPARISFQEIASGLTEPIFITNAGDESGRMFIVEQPGRIRIRKNGTLLATPFLDIQSFVKSTGGEQGLLALAFDPLYAANGNFYVAYTAPRNGDLTGSNLVLEKFSASANNPDLANPNSGVILLTISHPSYSNHNGGSLAFGHDGYLYWSTGDGGSGGDPGNNAQNLASLLGKILRIDVHSGSPYGIPASNPFYSSIDPNVKKEIWAYGLRNPWRLSFDRLTHDLYIGDVGQSAREEVDFQPTASVGGENYGWRVMEGSLCYNPSNGCNQSGKILPVAEYDHALGCSITGGYVYRGSNFPSLYGYYFYGDYCSGRLFSLYKDPLLGWKSVQLLNTPYSISTFGEDQQGELYLADYATGKLYNIGYQETFQISGNAGAAGVTLSYTDGSPKTATSLPDGAYSFTVSYDWSGTVTPSKACYIFNPPNKNYSNVVTDQAGQNYAFMIDSGSGCANVAVSIGGTNQGTYGIPSQGNLAMNYVGIDNGPVKVVSTNAVPIVTGLRELWTLGGTTSSFQMMGLPSSQLSDTYWFPSYNNVTLNEQVRFGNVDVVDTNVTVTIGATSFGPYLLHPNEQLRVNYAGLDSGPVKVQSSGGVKIIAAIRDAWLQDTAVESFSQLMGLPDSQLSDTYWFPSYNNVTLSEQLRFGNVGAADTNVTVTIGATSFGPYLLHPNEQFRINYAGMDSGPVKVQSSGSVPIIAAIREAWFQGSAVKSWIQLMGLPGPQLSNTYYFPAYDNVSLSGQLRFGNVGASNTTVTVTIGGVVKGSYPLTPNQQVRVSYAGLDSGPVEITSSGGVKIIAALRDALFVNGVVESFAQMMGLPGTQVSTTYWLPAYNNVTLDEQLRFGVP